VLTSTLIDGLERKYRSLWPEDLFANDPHFNPFKLLILAILSQNTSDINSSRAYKSLAANFDITPLGLKKADLKKIEKAIKIGGIYKIKARRIKTVAQEVIARFHGNIKHILALPKNTARKKLTALSGVGNKAADIMLSYQYSYREVIPIDTHMQRIAQRLGLVREKTRYKDIQDSFMSFIPARRRARAARLIWLLAKYTCRARHPKCPECPLVKICKYENKTL
jgi:endonuclease-3